MNNNIKLQKSYEPEVCPDCGEKRFARLEVAHGRKSGYMTIYEYCLNPACKEHDYILCEGCGKIMKVSESLPHLPYCDCVV